MVINATHGVATSGPVTIARIGVADLWDALAKGAADFRSMPSHLLFLGLLYPVVIIVVARLVLGQGLIQLAYPVITGGALLGPLVAIGLYEISRRRELGLPVSWKNAFDVVKSPAIVSIVILGVFLTSIFVAWLVAAQTIYERSVEGAMPASFSGALEFLFATEAGWTLIVVGNGVGFLFALLVLAISVVSFPMLVHRNVGVVTAVATSLRVVAVNFLPMMGWGMIVALLLLLGSLPAFIGLAIVVPLLGHATWHLYRKVIPD